MRTLFAIVLLFLPLAALAAPDCLIGEVDETDDWGNWITVTSNGGECNNVARAPLATDLVGVQYGTIDVIADLTGSTDTAGIEVQSGAAFDIDTTTAGIGTGVDITFSGGQDGVGVGVYDDVVFWLRPGASSTIQSGILERYFSGSPEWVTEASKAAGTIWTVGGHSACDQGASDVSGWMIGGVGDCTSGTQEYKNTISWTLARNNPLDGLTGDNGLTEALDEVGTSIATGPVIIYFLSGLDAGHAYAATYADDIGGIVGLTYDVRQIAPGYSSAGAAAFPLADRWNLHAYVQDSVAVYEEGETCIETETSIISADDEGMGFCMYIYENGGGNGIRKPLPVGASRDSEDCSGGAATGDSFFFSEEHALPKDITGTGSPGRVVLSPSCAGYGDEFIVLDPPVFTVLAAGHVAGEGKFLLEGAVNWKGVIIQGSAEVICDGCTGSFQQAHIWESGENGLPALFFDNVSSFSVQHSSLVGGPVTGSGLGMTVQDTAQLSFRNFTTRYIGNVNYNFAGNAGSSGYVSMEGVSCERHGKIGSTVEKCFYDLLGAVNYIGVSEFFVTDLGIDTASYVFDVGLKPVVVNGMGIYGQHYGGIAKAGTNLGLKLYDVAARKFTMSVASGTGAFVDRHLANCDIKNLVVEVMAATNALTNDDLATVEGCLFEDFVGYNTLMFEIEDSGGGSTFRNNKIVNPTTVATGNVNYIFQYTPDDAPSTKTVIENNTIVWTDEQTTLFTEVVHAAGTDHDDDVLVLAGNAIIDMENASATADAPVKGFNLGPNLTADIDYKGKDNCIASISASGAGTPTIEYVANPANYVTPVIAGEPPTHYNVDVNPEAPSHSLMVFRDCGVFTGAAEPGVKGHYPWLSDRMGFKVGR
jgi:hypothetical protein